MNQIPSGWVRTTLGELTAPLRETITPTADDNRSYLGLEHVEPETTRITGSSPATSLRSTTVRFDGGDTLYGRLRPYLNKVCVPNFPGLASSEFMVFKPSPTLVPGLLLYLLNSPSFVSFANLVSDGDRPRVKWAQIESYPVALPPLGEQRRIVAAIEEQFSRLDAAEASLGSAQLKLGFLRARLLEQVTSGAGEWLTVEDVAEVQGGIQKQPKRRPVQNRFPFLRVANVLRGRLDLSEVHEIELFGDELQRLRLQPGDLLVVEGNGSLDQIGRSAMWRGEIENCVHQNHLIRVRPASKVDPTYLNLFWNAPKTAGRIASIASSTSGLYTLSAAKVRSVPVRVPPLDEQRRIVAEVERQLSILDATKAAIDRALERSKALRRAILERAFTGRLVPQDPSDEPASLLLERIRAERAAALPRRAPSRRRATMAAQPSLPDVVGEPDED